MSTKWQQSDSWKSIRLFSKLPVVPVKLQIKLLCCQGGNTICTYTVVIKCRIHSPKNCVIFYPMFSMVTSLALGQSYDYPSASEVNMEDMGKQITWIYIIKNYNTITAKQSNGYKVTFPNAMCQHGKLLSAKISCYFNFSGIFVQRKIYILVPLWNYPV